MIQKKIEDRLKHNDKNIPYIIPAYKIIEQVSGLGYIEEYINDMLLIISDDIATVINSIDKKNYSVTQLQTMFDVPGMDNRRAQMYIYFHLLRALKRSKYIPTLKIIGASNTQKVFIYVRWFSDENIKVERYMNDFIQAHIINQDNSKYIKPIRRRHRKSN